MLDGGVTALDDANLRWLETNLGLVNTYRCKWGWPGLDPSLTDVQTGKIHWLRALDLVRSSFEDVTHLEDEYNLGFAEDPNFAWFDTEFRIKTEQQEALKHRFLAFQVRGFKE